MSRLPTTRISLVLLSLLTIALVYTTYALYADIGIHRIKGPSRHDASKETATPTPTPTPDPNIRNPGLGGMGKHFEVKVTPHDKSAKIPNCEYPLLIHVTPDVHCTGALTTYASIVNNVLTQPEALRNKTCVHVTYIDPDMESVEEMYKWKPTKNPFPEIKDCAALDTSPELNEIVPLQFQALAPIEKPSFMDTLADWLAALNKVHSWGFDLYPRILLVDADSILLSDIHKIFDEAPYATIAAAPDQFKNCHDRSRLNGGMVLLKPSRYFHISAAELLYDQQASCFSGKWHQSEQELINCICGYTYKGYKPLRPEFTCSILPLYNSVWPRNYACSGANVEPMRSIHFTPTKPWKLQDAWLDQRADTFYWKCLRDGSRAGSLNHIQNCTQLSLDDTYQLSSLETFVHDLKEATAKDEEAEALKAAAEKKEKEEEKEKKQ